MHNEKNNEDSDIFSSRRCSVKPTSKCASGAWVFAWFRNFQFRNVYQIGPFASVQLSQVSQGFRTGCGRRWARGVLPVMTQCQGRASRAWCRDATCDRESQVADPGPGGSACGPFYWLSPTTKPESNVTRTRVRPSGTGRPGAPGSKPVRV